MLATTAFLLNQLGKNVVPFHKGELFSSLTDGRAQVSTPQYPLYIMDDTRYETSESKFVVVVNRTRKGFV